MVQRSKTYDGLRSRAQELQISVNFEPINIVYGSCRAPESHDADAHAPLHSADQRVQQKSGQSSALGCVALYVLQLLPDSSDVEGDACDGS
jgi:hypothetical protein